LPHLYFLVLFPPFLYFFLTHAALPGRNLSPQLESPRLLCLTSSIRRVHSFLLVHDDLDPQKTLLSSLLWDLWSFGIFLAAVLFDRTFFPRLFLGDVDTHLINKVVLSRVSNSRQRQSFISPKHSERRKPSHYVVARSSLAPSSCSKFFFSLLLSNPLLGHPKNFFYLFFPPACACRPLSPHCVFS